MGISNQAGPTVDRLRADIDSGRTGDKIPGSDPAAAPLGTDDEAAGTPIGGGLVAQARRAEVRGPGHSCGDGKRLGAAWVLIGFCGLLAATIAVWGAIQVW
jgi:hypothetical protein